MKNSSLDKKQKEQKDGASNGAEIAEKLNLKEKLNLEDINNTNLESLIDELLGPLADDYSLRILAATREEGKTVRDLSRELDIPIATCYRRVEELLEASLLEIKEKKLTQDGKRATVLRTSISFIEISFGFEDQSLNINIEPSKNRSDIPR